MNSNLKKSKTKKKLNGRLILNSIIILFLSCVLVGSVGGFYVLGKIIEESPNVNLGDFDSLESTRVFDNKGDLIYELGQENRENITYDQLPQVVVDAFLSIEDSRFFKHNGFDLPRFIKSAYENILSGSFAQGGSTLTMQMVDNTYFAEMEPSKGPIESIARKIQEIFMSMDVETKLSKEKIIELYVNKINFGGPARGIQKGAQYYFGKDIWQVNLSEAAFLAGVINAPNAYNPYNGYNPQTNVDHYQAAVERRNETLYLMNYHGYITAEEYQLAKNTELAFQLDDKMSIESDPLLSYIDIVIKEVRDLTGDDPYVIPMDIYTHMDLGAQELADEIMNGKVRYPSGDDLFQVGFSLVNNQTGEIVALGGGRGYGGPERHNRGFDLAKQPGSSVKPLVEYALAFDYLGYATSHIFTDKPITYRGTNTVLYNADGRFRGDINFKDVVGISLNTPALQTLQDLVDTIGVSRVVTILNSMGLDIDPNQFDLGYSIGGSNFAISPTQLAGAYQIFANGGKYIEPHTVERIEYKDGSEEVVEPTHEPVQVISPQAAYLMSTILYNAVNYNYGNLLQIVADSYPVYGKTGTTDWAEDGLAYGIPKTAMKDKWMVNYTSQYTVATWAGYDVPVAGKNTYFDLAKMNLNVPGQINNLMLDYTVKEGKPKAIARPSGVVEISHVEGVYPYVGLPEGADSSLLTTGLIKSEFAKLEVLETPSLDALTSFTANYNAQANSLALQFSKYPNSADPDTDMTQEFKGTQEWDLFGIRGSGKKFFDPRLLFGSVEYKADIYVNDKLIDTLAYGLENQSVPYVLPGGKNIKVCGYYGFAKADQKSNEICVNFKTDAEIVDPPVTTPTDPNNGGN